jgi:hypothetical protein
MKEPFQWNDDGIYCRKREVVGDRVTRGRQRVRNIHSIFIIRVESK